MRPIFWQRLGFILFILVVGAILWYQKDKPKGEIPEER